MSTVKQLVPVTFRNRVVPHDPGVWLSSERGRPHLQRGDHPGQEQRCVQGALHGVFQRTRQTKGTSTKTVCRMKCKWVSMSKPRVEKGSYFFNSAFFTFMIISYFLLRITQNEESRKINKIFHSVLFIKSLDPHQQSSAFSLQIPLNVTLFSLCRWSPDSAFHFASSHTWLPHAHSSFLLCPPVRNMYRTHCVSSCQRRCTSAWGRREDTSTCVGMLPWPGMFSRLSSKSSSSRATWAWRMLASSSASSG